MSFLASSYLWVLPVAVLPIVIYLIFRRRRQDVAWGSVYILRRVLESRSRVRAWLQYLILALRVLALAALVAVFAQPSGTRPDAVAGAFPAPPPSTHRIILLDHSASMAARQASGTRLESALSLCRSFLNSGSEPGRLDLLPMDGRTDPIVGSSTGLPLPQERREELLAACSQPVGIADLAKGLRSAATLFRASPCERKELYLLSDFTAADWRDADDLTRLLGDLTSSGVRVRCLGYGSEQINNLAVLDLTANSDLLLARQPALFHARIGCYGNRPSVDTVLSVEVDAGTPFARVLHDEPLSLAPGEKTVDFPLELPAGRHTLTARLRDDDLATDNVLVRVIEVRPVLNVAVIQDINDAKGFDNPRTWLQLALEKAKASGATTSRVNSTVEAALAANEASKNADFKATDDAGKPCEIVLQGKIPEQVNAELLRSLDLVIICGVSRVPPEALEALRGFVRQGGTLLLAPDPATPPADFNQTYGTLAPAALEAPRHRELDVERYEQCLAESTEYPLLRELESPEHGNLGNPRFYNWFTLTPPAPTENREALLALTDGSPLLLERRIGRGSTMLWTAGLGQAWHSMVVHPAYPVFLVRLANFAAARLQFPKNLAVGAPILMPTTATQVRVVRPDGQSATIATTAVGDHRFVRYEQTDLAGVYDLREDLASTTPGVLFTVAAAMPESDLRPLSADIQARLERAAGAPLVQAESALVEDAIAAYPGRSWLLPIALLLLLGVLLEAALSRRFFA